MFSSEIHYDFVNLIITWTMKWGALDLDLPKFQWKRGALEIEVAY